MLVTEIIKPKCGFEYKYDFREIEELLRQGTSIQNSSGLQQPMFKPHAGRTPNQASPRSKIATRSLHHQTYRTILQSPQLK